MQVSGIGIHSVCINASILASGCIEETLHGMISISHGLRRFHSKGHVKALTPVCGAIQQAAPPQSCPTSDFKASIPSKATYPPRAESPRLADSVY